MSLNTISNFIPLCDWLCLSHMFLRLYLSSIHPRSGGRSKSIRASTPYCLILCTWMVHKMPNSKVFYCLWFNKVSILSKGSTLLWYGPCQFHHHHLPPLPSWPLYMPSGPIESLHCKPLDCMEVCSLTAYLPWSNSF